MEDVENYAFGEKGDAARTYTPPECITPSDLNLIGREISMVNGIFGRVGRRLQLVPRRSVHRDLGLDDGYYLLESIADPCQHGRRGQRRQQHGQLADPALRSQRRCRRQRAQPLLTEGMTMLPVTETAHAVRKLDGGDVLTVSRSMARAFYDDPVVGHWCRADEAKRMARLERIFALWLHLLYLPHDECYTDVELRGGAFWLPPGTWKLGAVGQLRLIAQTARITGGATERIVRALTALEAKHPHEPHHYYLQFLGVEPDAQNQGVGSALLRPVLERCDRDGVPAHLEASSERNVRLYQRHGVAIVEEIDLPRGGQPLWRMWREPQAA